MAEAVVAAALLLAGCWLASRGGKQPTAAQIMAQVRRILSPPTYRVSKTGREPIVFELSEEHAVLPIRGYPSKDGLNDLAKYYQPQQAFLTKHKEWVVGCRGHSCLYSGAALRPTLMGHLYERHRALQKCFDSTSCENLSHLAEIARLRSLLEGATQQEELLKENCVRERELRKVAEREKGNALAARAELEQMLQQRIAEVQHLQSLLQEAASATHQSPLYEQTSGGVNGSTTVATYTSRRGVRGVGI